MTLELFPKHPRMDAYRVGGAYQPYAIVGVDKRFSDAELCAEYWAAALDADIMAPSYLVAITATVGRFATLPHASDTNYE